MAQAACCTCVNCEDSKPCVLCGDLLTDEVARKTPRWMDVEFHFVCPCWCDQCFTCGGASYKLMSTPLHGYMEPGDPTNPQDDVEVYQTTRVYQDVSDPSTYCTWLGRLGGNLFLRTYAGGACGGDFYDLFLPIEVKVQKLTDLVTDLSATVENQSTQADWRVEAWADAVDITPYMGSIPPEVLEQFGNPVSLVSPGQWEQIKAAVPSLANAPTIPCRIDCFGGNGPGCGCTQDGNVENSFACPPREMDPLISPSPQWQAYWNVCEKPAAPGWKCVATGGPVSGPSHCCGYAVIVPCKHACPSSVHNPCPECAFDAPEYIHWSWDQIRDPSCTSAVPRLVVGAASGFGTFGVAKRIAPCKWRYIGFQGNKGLCNAPVIEPANVEMCAGGRGNTPPDPMCHRFELVPSDDLCDAVVLEVLITRLATQWQTVITVGGVMGFSGTSAVLGQDCTLNPPVTIQNTILVNAVGPSGGRVTLSCDECNCAKQCRCDPDCCCAAMMRPNEAARGLNVGPGAASLTWAASCTNQGVPGVESTCDCYMFWVGSRNCIGEPPGAICGCRAFPFYKIACAWLGTGSESLCPGPARGAITYWDRKRYGFQSCATGTTIRSFRRYVTANHDPCTGIYDFSMNLLCCEDTVCDDLPCLGWSYKSKAGCCARAISGVRPDDSGCCCAENCPGGGKALITFSFVPPAPSPGDQYSGQSTLCT